MLYVIQWVIRELSSWRRTARRMVDRKGNTVDDVYALWEVNRGKSTGLPMKVRIVSDRKKGNSRTFRYALAQA